MTFRNTYLNSLLVTGWLASFLVAFLILSDVSGPARWTGLVFVVPSGVLVVLIAHSRVTINPETVTVVGWHRRVAFSVGQVSHFEMRRNRSYGQVMMLVLKDGREIRLVPFECARGAACHQVAGLAATMTDLVRRYAG